MIEVGEDATHTTLRGLIPLALQWRDRLLEYQGPDPRRFETALKRQLLDAKRSGTKMTELAQRLNRHAAELLRAYAPARDAKVEATRLGAQRVEAGEDREAVEAELTRKLLEREGLNFLAGEELRDLLEALHLASAEIQAYVCEDPATVMRPGILKTYPISGDKIASVLRAWELNRKHELLDGAGAR